MYICISFNIKKEVDMKKIYFKTFILSFIVFVVLNINASEKPGNFDNKFVNCLDLESSNILLEENRDIEFWMINEVFWELGSGNITDFDFIKEEERIVEDWMLNEDFWKIDKTIDEEIALESWMFDLNFWTI